MTASGRSNCCARTGKSSTRAGSMQEVRGEGVVGEMPLIAPGESFDYVSGCPLDTASGSMRGSYRMVDEDGETFDVDNPAVRAAQPGLSDKFATLARHGQP